MYVSHTVAPRRDTQLQAWIDVESCVRCALQCDAVALMAADSPEDGALNLGMMEAPVNALLQVNAPEVRVVVLKVQYLT